MRSIRALIGIGVLLLSAVPSAPTASASTVADCDDWGVACWTGDQNYAELSYQGIYEHRRKLKALAGVICDESTDGQKARAQWIYAIRNVNDAGLIRYIDAPAVMTAGPGAGCREYTGMVISYSDADWELWAVDLKYDYSAFGKSGDTEALTWRYRAGWQYNPYAGCPTCKTG